MALGSVIQRKSWANRKTKSSAFSHHARLFAGQNHDKTPNPAPQISAKKRAIAHDDRPPIHHNLDSQLPDRFEQLLDFHQRLIEVSFRRSLLRSGRRQCLFRLKPALANVYPSLLSVAGQSVTEA